MNLEEVREFCFTLPEVTEDIKWETHLCLCIKEKMFVICESVGPFSASLKVDEEEFYELTELENIIPAPYMARNKWICIKDQNAINASEWKRLIVNSYQMVVAKLPKSKRPKY